jgi:hypothetical protein
MKMGEKKLFKLNFSGSIYVSISDESHKEEAENDEKSTAEETKEVDEKSPEIRNGNDEVVDEKCDKTDDATANDVLSSNAVTQQQNNKNGRNNNNNNKKSKKNAKGKLDSQTSGDEVVADIKV